MHRLSSWAEERSAPVAATLIIVAAGLVYTVSWSVMAHHGWQSVGDLWNSADISLALAHGHLGAVYGLGSQIDSPPGFEYLLAPFMAIGHAVGFRTWAEVHPHYPVFWLVLAPFATVLASSALFALDAVARSWGYGERQRLALSLVAGLGVVSATMFWGHPEDCISFALVVWAALAVERRGAGGLPRAAWLLGLAVAFQPLALLAVAPVLARFGWRALPGAAWRLALPSVVVVLPELVTHAGQTLHQIADQPFWPADESSTPFTPLARSLGHGMYSGGTLRAVATVAALALGWVACRRRHDLPWVVAAIAACFTVRVVFESELLGFYFYPVLALALLLALRRGWSWFGFAGVLAVVNTVLGNRREHAIALWWPAMVATTLLLLWIAYRGAMVEPVLGTGPVEEGRGRRGAGSYVGLLDF